jgi:hypothetical protein
VISASDMPKDIGSIVFLSLAALPDCRCMSWRSGAMEG